MCVHAHVRARQIGRRFAFCTHNLNKNLHNFLANKMETKMNHSEQANEKENRTYFLFVLTNIKIVLFAIEK